MNKIIELTKYLLTKGVNKPLKVQKILFFLRIEEKKSNHNFGYFKDNHNFQAWIYGPVNRDSFFYAKGYFLNENEAEDYLLDDKELSKIDELYGKWFEEYNNLTINELVKKSHKNKAWIKARLGYDDNQPCKVFLDESTSSFLEFE